jgi:hypothetical protein
MSDINEKPAGIFNGGYSLLVSARLTLARYNKAIRLASPSSRDCRILTAGRLSSGLLVIAMLPLIASLLLAWLTYGQLTRQILTGDSMHPC